MNSSLRLRQAVLAAAAVAAGTSFNLPQPAVAAEKAAAKAAGTYVTGDFHNHSTCSDGTLSMQKLIDKSVNTWGLDWFVQADHGGSSTRNCTLAEDPFTPVAPALGLTTSSTGPWPPATYPSGGEPATALKGPNQTWESTIGRAAIKGDGTATPKAMWRWQEIQEFQYASTEVASRTAKKPVWLGLEQNVPGHEHSSTNVLAGQLPWPTTTGTGNANLQAQYEYCFDRSDSDTSRGATNQWDCSVTGSSNNSYINATAAKITGNNSAATPGLGHIKTVEGIKWMAQVAPTTSYFIPAHLERAGVYNPNGSSGFNIEHLRNFNNAAPNIAFGFESMPGHGAEAQRGSYTTNAVGGGTFGGTGIYAAAVGGVWDALLGEGRNWWFFASSDYHNRGSFGPDQLETTADFYPGEYTRDHVLVRKGTNNLSAEKIIDGLRSGNSFVANGQLIDRLAFVVCATNPTLPLAANQTFIEKAVANAVAANAEVRINGCATMGEKLVVRAGESLFVTVALRDPEGKNNSPYSFANPSLKQISITQPLNAPVLDHVDLISGNVTGKVDPTSANYAGLIGSSAASNTSSKIAKVFNSTNWTSMAGGVKVMTLRVPAVTASQFVRLRGTNLPAATPSETDANGNPLLDFISNPNDQTLAGTIPCSDAACPAHMRTVNGVKYSSFDVAAWADLWFYSNPVFVEVKGSTAIAAIK
jgi:hypothetical protein